MDIFDKNNTQGLGAYLYNTGDMVYVHKNLRPTKKGLVVTDDMVKYAGKITKIKRKRNWSYSLEIDDGNYNWEDFMLEPLDKSPVIDDLMAML